MLYKTLHRKLKIIPHEPHKNHVYMTLNIKLSTVSMDDSSLIFIFTYFIAFLHFYVSF